MYKCEEGRQMRVWMLLVYDAHYHLSFLIRRKNCNTNLKIKKQMHRLPTEKTQSVLPITEGLEAGSAMPRLKTRNFRLDNWNHNCLRADDADLFKKTFACNLVIVRTCPLHQELGLTVWDWSLWSCCSVLMLLCLRSLEPSWVLNCCSAFLDNHNKTFHHCRPLICKK